MLVVDLVVGESEGDSVGTLLPLEELEEVVVGETVGTSLPLAVLEELEEVVDLVGITVVCDAVVGLAVRVLVGEVPLEVPVLWPWVLLEGIVLVLLEGFVLVVIGVPLLVIVLVPLG